MNTDELLAEYTGVMNHMSDDFDALDAAIASNWNSMSAADYKEFVRCKAKTLLEDMHNVQNELEQVLALKKAENDVKRLKIDLLRLVSRNLKLQAGKSRHAKTVAVDAFEERKNCNMTSYLNCSEEQKFSNQETFEQSQVNTEKTNILTFKPPRLSDYGLSELGRSILDEQTSQIDVNRGKFPVSPNLRAPRLSDYGLSELGKSMMAASIPTDIPKPE